MKRFLLDTSSSHLQSLSTTELRKMFLWIAILFQARPPVNVHDVWAAAAFLLEPNSFYHSSDIWQKGPSFFPPTGGPILPQDIHSTNYKASTGARHLRDPGCCPSALSKRKESVDRLQYCAEHSLLLISKPQKLFGVGMAPGILIIERFLGHIRFISRKQGPSSDFQHTVIQQYPFFQLRDFY